MSRSERESSLNVESCNRQRQLDVQPQELQSRGHAKCAWLVVALVQPSSSGSECAGLVGYWGLVLMQLLLAATPIMRYILLQSCVAVVQRITQSAFRSVGPLFGSTQPSLGAEFH
jgi:hypothetical protein